MVVQVKVTPVRTKVLAGAEVRCWLGAQLYYIALPSNVEDGAFVSSEITGGISRLSPNPLTRTAEIEYSLPVDCQVTLGVYDIQGQRVAILTDEPHSAGRSVAHWDGKDMVGSPVPSGIYFCRLEASGFVQVRTITVVR